MSTIRKRLGCYKTRVNLQAANATRGFDKPGTYEAWYVTISEAAKRRGFWIRYTLFNPGKGSDAQAHSALWAFTFDHDDPARNWGSKRSFPFSALKIGAKPFGVRIGDSQLEAGGCSGLFDSERGRARWDLRWESREPPFPFIQPRWQGISTVANIGAQPALTVTGTIEMNGKAFRLDGAPGGQQHTWGESHALAWNWGFASSPKFWLDGATSRVKSRLGGVIVGTALGAQMGEHRFTFNNPLKALQNPATPSSEAWTCEAQLGDRRLSVSIKPRREDLIGVTYNDPKGGTRTCYHTEVADLEMRLTRKKEVLAEIKHPAAAAFEFASEQPLPGLKPLF